MRVAALVLVGVAGLGCRRGSLEEDAGGAGRIGFDGGTRGDPAVGDGAVGSPDAPSPPDARFPTADNNCGKSSIAGSRLLPEILVVFDRSVSANSSFLSAFANMMSRNDASVDWGLFTFPADGPACGAGTVGDTVDVDPLPGSATHVLAHIVHAGTGTGGKPTAAAIDVAATYMLSRETMNPRFLMLVTDGAPTCAGVGSFLTADSAQGVTDAVAAIAAAKAMGLPTFVVAPSSTAGGDVDALNALATAGGYAERGAVQFDTEASFSSWFETTTDASGCAVPIAPPPPVPDFVTVTFNGATVPRDRSHTLGWDYTDSIGNSISLYGTWCDMVKTSTRYQVDVYYGCPNPG